MRGNPQDFDHWALLSNDSTWCYENILPYFKKLEDYHGNFPSGILQASLFSLFFGPLIFSVDYHGKYGPLHISKQRFEPMVEDWLKGGQEFGISTRDPNALQTKCKFPKILLWFWLKCCVGQPAMFPIDVNMKDGRRYGAYNAYLKPALSNGKLKVLRRALVDKARMYFMIASQLSKCTVLGFLWWWSKCHWTIFLAWRKKLQRHCLQRSGYFIRCFGHSANFTKIWHRII